MPHNKVKYVSLEPAAFLVDVDVQIMTAAQVGAYCLLCFNLYEAGGRLKYDLEHLQRLCKANGDFDFQLVLGKFQVRRGFIYHRRVTAELKRAQLRTEAARKAAIVKWEKQYNRNASALKAQCQVKLSEVKGSKEYICDKPISIYTISQVQATAITIGLSEQQAKEWFEHYEPQGFVFGNGLPIINLSSALVKWKNNQYKFDNKSGQKQPLNPEQKKEAEIKRINKKQDEIRRDYATYIREANETKLKDLWKHEPQFRFLIKELRPEILVSSSAVV